MKIFTFMFSILFSLFAQIDEESLNQGNGICFICKFPTLPHEDAFFLGACFNIECLNDLSNGWIETLEFDLIPFNLWLCSNWDGVVELVMVDGQFHLDWPSNWPLNKPVVESWPDDPDSEWKAAKAEYERIAPSNTSDSVSEGEILIIFDSKENEAEVSEDNETIVSDAPNTEVVDAADA